MMRRALVLCLGVCVVLSMGCRELGQLRKQNASLKAQLSAATATNDDLSKKLAAAQATGVALDQNLTETQAKARQLEQLVSRLQAEKAALDKQRQDLEAITRNMAGIGVKSTDEGNFLVLESDIMFDLGKVDLKDNAKRALDKVAEYLNDHPTQMIRVDGHTDGVPIRVSQWEDNFHLGAMRAHAVMKYLMQKGVKPDRMYIAGFGPNRPAVQPDSPTQPVAQNRRVEIFLVPTGMSSISQMVDSFRQ